LGPEVSAKPAYQRRRLALDGAPEDLLEDRSWPVQGQAGEPDAPTVGVPVTLHAPVPEPVTEADEEIDDLGIEDAVIRELARALQPRRDR
jgi:hypothetical protein